MTSPSPAKELDLLPDIFARWFASRGWAPRAHQLDLLAHARDGRSVLLIAPTGGGKTLAGFLPTLVELAERGAKSRRLVPTGRDLRHAGGLHTLYIKALSVSKPMYSPDGHFEPGAVGTAYAVLRVFDPAVGVATFDLAKTYNDTFVKKAVSGK